MTRLVHHFEVRKTNLRESRFVESGDASDQSLQANQVLLRIEHFAFTANNVTYAAFGDVMQYWNFFPTESGWGRIPVWGFAVVEASRHEQVSIGDRVYGYFPMSSHLVVQADRVTSAGFVDASAHRQPMAAIYNQYTRCATDPGYDAQREAEQMLLRPLFLTSFLIDDFLADNHFFGAHRVVLSSASSKTAYGTAFMLSARGSSGVEAGLDQIVGLTSSRNLPFVQGTGFYQQAIAYEQISSLPLTPTVYVDMSGDREVREAIHRHLGDALKYSCAVGGTHWEQISGVGSAPATSGAAASTASTTSASPSAPPTLSLPGPKPALFFAPAQAKKRFADWGAAEFGHRTARAWTQFMTRVLQPGRALLTVNRQLGASAMQSRYLEVLEGKTAADQGIVLGFER